MKEHLFSVGKDDFDWSFFRCSGKGGQKVNKTSSGVRCTHRPSGAVGKSCDERQQPKNRRLAWERCIESNEFKTWLNQKVFELTRQKEVEAQIARELEKVRVEVFQNGEWLPEGVA